MQLLREGSIKERSWLRAVPYPSPYPSLISSRLSWNIQYVES
ncbi:hypothetical protein V3C99_008323, partial [Haemonchus contortus]